jgi:ribonuclease HI
MFLYTDGASRGNPGEAAVCFRLLESTGQVLREEAQRIGRATNNQAEYRALIAGLEGALVETAGPLQCRSDSELMVKQMRGEYRVKDAALKPLWEQAQELTRQFVGIEFVHVPRSDPDIARADELANQALDAPPG